MEMMNKKVLITGATDGIGRQTALDLAEMGAHVLIHGMRETRSTDVTYDPVVREKFWRISEEMTGIQY